LRCCFAFKKLSFIFFSLSATISPAAQLRATASENSLSSPLKISIILLALNSAFFPFRFSLFFF